MKKIIKSFFYSGDKFQPIYFWVTVFCSLIALMILLRCANLSKLSDTLILGVFALVEMLIGIYNHYKSSKTVQEDIDNSLKNQYDDLMGKGAANVSGTNSLPEKDEKQFDIENEEPKL